MTKEELEKENAELKEQVKEWKALQELYDGKAFKWQGKYGDVNKQLTKAKKIIKDQKELLDSVLSGAETLSDFAQSTLRKAEQFLEGK